jgi:hypothetical protein
MTSKVTSTQVLSSRETEGPTASQRSTVISPCVQRLLLFARNDRLWIIGRFSESPSYFRHGLKPKTNKKFIISCFLCDPRHTEQLHLSIISSQFFSPFF